MARNKYDVDEVLEDKFDVNQLKRLLAYLIPYRKRFVSVGFMMLSASAFTMLIPQFFQKVMDVCIPNKDMKGIAFYSFLTLLAAFYSAFSLRYKIKYTNQIGQQIIHDMRYDIFEHLQELPFSYYDDRPHGKIQVRVVNYVNSISDLLSNGILNTITDLCNLVFIIVFMLILNVRLTLVCLCGLPILAIVIVVIKKKQRTAWQVQSNKQSNLNAYIAESINGIRVTQSFVREDVNSGIFNNLSGSYRKSWMRAVMFNFTMGPSIDIISIITTAAIYVLGVSWMINGETGITVGVLVAFTAYIGRFWAPINTLAGFYNSLLTAISYLELIFETIDEPVVVKDRKDAVEMPPIHGDVAFDHVTFSYEPGVPILKDVSFHANQGQSFAVGGPTGAGKTTMLKAMLMRCPPNERIVTVEEVRELGMIQHANHVSLVTREANTEGAGGIGLSELICATLRMRPDRVVVGECRGGEVVDLLRALNSGHRGGMTTLHANQVEAVPARLVSLGLLAGLEPRATAALAEDAFDVVLHVERIAGRRRIAQVGRLEAVEGRLHGRLLAAWDGRTVRAGQRWDGFMSRWSA